MSELLPCPFCGGEAEVYEMQYGADGQYSVFGVFCVDDSKAELIGLNKYQHGHFIDNFPTEAEAIAAWNSRAPIEYDGWFYLPKPKEGIVVYGEPEITRTENGYKVRHIADVVDEAARRWSDELGEYVMRRICEVWNSRAERTCTYAVKDNMNETEGMGDVWFECSACNCKFDYYADEWLMKMSYCPNCGARVIG